MKVFIRMDFQADIRRLSEVSHVGIYVGNHMMLHCGDVRPDRTEVEVDERRIEKGPTP